MSRQREWLNQGRRLGDRTGMRPVATAIQHDRRRQFIRGGALNLVVERQAAGQLQGHRAQLPSLAAAACLTLRHESEIVVRW